MKRKNKTLKNKINYTYQYQSLDRNLSKKGYFRQMLTPHPTDVFYLRNTMPLMSQEDFHSLTIRYEKKKKNKK